MKRLSIYENPEIGGILRKHVVLQLIKRATLAWGAGDTRVSKNTTEGEKILRGGPQQNCRLKKKSR